LVVEADERFMIVGAWPRRRRSREEVLAGIAGAKESRERRRQAEQEARRIA
jgi:hypothetical protein